jgi:L,D-peptidoglycan transpeptidase YkuD (ErfK/YbiS/YcfS/YnhG family)
VGLFTTEDAETTEKLKFSSMVLVSQSPNSLLSRFLDGFLTGCLGLLVTGCWLVAAQAQTRRPSGLESSTQLLVVTTSRWDAVEGRLQRYERTDPGKNWKAVGQSVNVVVGKSGLGWGLGLLPADSHLVRAGSDPVKKEGDGRAPAGVFRLSSAFGYAPQQPPGWKMPYIGVMRSVECVDDTSSKFYNLIVDRGTVSPDWSSSEHMLLSDERYRWGIVVDHNAGHNGGPPAPGGGSCIFLHIWLGPDSSTVGCTAMPQEQLEAVLAWLDPARSPILVQLPMPKYKALKKQWRLPPLTGAENHRKPATVHSSQFLRPS